MSIGIKCAPGVVGPAEADIDFDIIRNDNDTFTVRYTPRGPGAYTIMVLFADQVGTGEEGRGRGVPHEGFWGVGGLILGSLPAGHPHQPHPDQGRPLARRQQGEGGGTRPQPLR